MAAPAGRRGLVIILTVAAVAVCLLALAAWGYWPWRDKPQVAVPPPTASPRQVVQAYLRALDAHDSATAEALSTPGFRATTDLWLNTTASITRISIGAVQYFPLAPAGQRYEVPVEFWYSSHWWKQDPSFPDGQEGWGYQLVRSHGRYLIDDDGVG